MRTAGKSEREAPPCINEASERLTDTTGRDVLIEIMRGLITYALHHFDEEGK